MKQIEKMSKPWLMAFIVISGIVLSTSCEKYSYVVEKANPEATVLFQTEIQPIFTSKCIMCHGGSRNPDLRDGKSYASLTTGGYVQLPAETSKLYLKITSSSHESRTLPIEKDKILFWIRQGAKNN
jgi:hypothetical protein